MLIIWNYGAVAQVNLGLRTSVYNWSGPAAGSTTLARCFVRRGTDALRISSKP